MSDLREVERVLAVAFVQRDPLAWLRERGGMLCVTAREVPGVGHDVPPAVVDALRSWVAECVARWKAEWTRQ